MYGSSYQKGERTHANAKQQPSPWLWLFRLLPTNETCLCSCAPHARASSQLRLQWKGTEVLHRTTFSTLGHSALVAMGSSDGTMYEHNSLPCRLTDFNVGCTIKDCSSRDDADQVV